MRKRKKKPDLQTRSKESDSFFNGQLQKKTAVTAGDTPYFAPRYGNGFKTICDVDIHPEDRTKYLLRKDIRHVGTGLPIVKTLAHGKGLKNSSPCVYEAAMAHEQVHVNNAKTNCKEFKKCLDDKVADNWVSDAISTEEYIKCKNAHKGGLASDCKKDEQEAYKKTVEVAENLVTQSKCATDVAHLNENIKEWKKYAITPPNC